MTGSMTSPEDSAELYLLSSGFTCSLPKVLYGSRIMHTLESSGLLCGGGRAGTQDSCVQWSPDTGSWNELLDIERTNHVSWTPRTNIGTYLIGGRMWDMRRTTTLIKPDGTQEPGFTLQYRTR